MTQQNVNEPLTPPLFTPTESKNDSFLKAHGQKLAALVFWLLAIGGYFWYAQQNNLTPLEVVNQLISTLRTSAYGPLLYIIVYALRPLLLFSAALLTIAAGLLFGPVGGIIYSMIGSNTSAMVAYVVGRYLAYISHL